MGRTDRICWPPLPNSGGVVHSGTKRMAASKGNRRVPGGAETAYRDQALKILPWICARCGREFEGRRVRELTVHHRDGNHDNNPPDGSNWELLCVYCHENEHARFEDMRARGGAGATPGRTEPAAKHRPFAGLDDLLKRKGGGK